MKTNENPDYSKPVAYDKDGNPLYAHPPRDAGDNKKLPPVDAYKAKPWLHTPEQVAASPHFQEAEQHLTGEGRSVFRFIEFDDDEDLVTEVRKHWFGALLIWIVGLSATLVVTVVPLLLAGQSDFLQGTGIDDSGFSAIFIMTGFFLGALAFLATALIALMFTKNVIFVTTDKIAQVKYSGLIHRKISQLGIGDVQDVTVHQNTIPSRLLNYGTLVVETAGEQNNYTFSYVPNPYQESKAIIWAREENVKRYGN